MLFIWIFLLCSLSLPWSASRVSETDIDFMNFSAACLTRVYLYCDVRVWWAKFCLFHRQWGSNKQIFDIWVHSTTPDQWRQARAPLCQANIPHSHSRQQPSTGFPLWGMWSCPSVSWVAPVLLQLFHCYTRKDCLNILNVNEWLQCRRTTNNLVYIMIVIYNLSTIHSVSSTCWC